MAGRGPAPKDPSKQLGHRTKAETATRKLGDAPASAPALPPPVGEGEWSAQVREWYHVWATSPQAAMFTATDWQRLHMIAPLVEAYYECADPMNAKALMAEIRLNEAALGATPTDRQRLRWTVEPAAPGDGDAEPQERRRERRDPRVKLRAVPD